MPGVLVVVAALLRLYRLDAESLWLDEAFSVVTGRASLETLLRQTSEDFHPPLYFVLLHAWMAVTDGSGWSARLLSVVFSVATVGAASWAGRTLADRTTGLVAGVLLAISVFQIEFAQEARMYALVACLATVSTVALVQMAQEHGAGPEAPSGASPWPPIVSRWWWAYAATSTLLLYTHAYSVFVFIAHAIAVASAWRGDVRGRRLAERWFTAMLVPAAAFLAWLPIFAQQFWVVQRGFWIPAPTWTDVASPIRTYAGSDALTWILAPLAALGFVRIIRQPRPGGSIIAPAWLVAAWLLMPIVLPLVLSFVSAPVFLPKYTIAASVAFALAAAAGIAWLPRLLRGVVLIVILAFAGQALQAFYQAPRKDNWRQTVGDVAAMARPGDAMVFYPYFTEIPWSLYWMRTDVRIAPVAKHAEAVTGPTLRAMFDGLIGTSPRVWLVLMEYDARRPLLLDHLGARYRTVTRHRHGHIDVYVADGPRPPGPDMTLAIPADNR